MKGCDGGIHKVEDSLPPWKGRQSVEEELVGAVKAHDWRKFQVEGVYSANGQVVLSLFEAHVAFALHKSETRSAEDGMAVGQRLTMMASALIDSWGSVANSPTECTNILMLQVPGC